MAVRFGGETLQQRSDVEKAADRDNYGEACENSKTCKEEK